MEFETAVRSLIETGRWISDKNMTWGTAGNISVRLDGNTLLVTGSGTRFDSLDRDSFALYNISDGTWTGRKPSKETPVHAAMYEQSPWCGAVVHASPYYTTLAASSGLTLYNDLFIENMYYLQRMVRIPYAHPGSAELSQAVRSVSAQNNVVLMENHGVILYDTSLSECCTALEVLENTCKMCLDATSAGIRLNHLHPDIVRSFLTESGYKKPRVWPDSGNEK